MDIVRSLKYKNEILILVSELPHYVNNIVGYSPVFGKIYLQVSRKASKTNFSKDNIN
jgi:hypothetical protein